jgi:hypothetical protein
VLWQGHSAINQAHEVHDLADLVGFRHEGPRSVTIGISATLTRRRFFPKRLPIVMLPVLICGQ